MNKNDQMEYVHVAPQTTHEKIRSKQISVSHCHWSVKNLPTTAGIMHPCLPPSGYAPD